MPKQFHINNEGDVGPCKAVFECPFGDLTNDHYATKEEALEAQEQRHTQKIKAKGLAKVPKKRLGDKPIKRTPSKIRLSPAYAEYNVDYDYDAYHCSEYGGCTEDYCHQEKYYGLRVSGWNNDDGLANYARDYLGLSKKEEFPESLKKQMTPYAATVIHDFKITPIQDYYGESVNITPPDYLQNDLEDYYWSQPNADDAQGSLSYLRDKGFETQGLRPLEATKTYISEKHGKRIADVDNCASIRKSSLMLKNIDKPRKGLQKNVVMNAEESQVYSKTGKTGKIQGIVLEKDDGTYELLEGHNPRHDEKSTRRKGNYLIISEQTEEQLRKNKRYRRF